MNIVFAAILFVFGLAAGSFLNVVAMRYEALAPDRSVKWRIWFGGRSRCPFCQTTLNWYELIPVLSFLIQRGKCRTCGRKLSWQYPIVELATAAAFVLAPSLLILELIIWLLASSTLILIAAIDARLSIIPDGAALFLAVLGFVSMIAKSVYVPHLLSALGGFLFFGALVLFSRGRAMGAGDVKLAGAIGLFLGWPPTLFAFMVAFVVGAVWGIFLILMKKKTLKDAVPFGPFLVIGTFIASFFTPTLFDIISL